MDPTTVDEIYENVKPFIEKKNTNMGDAISAHARLWVTLRFRASGVSYKELMYEFRISVSSIAKIVPSVWYVLYDVLKADYVRVPTKREQLEKLAEEFSLKWQFPHAVGAIDGKHINIRAPPNSATEYFNCIRNTLALFIWLLQTQMQNLLLWFGFSWKPVRLRHI